ncbi:hypothetical protein COCSADRAFT_272050 [Bipolaris sorokiniana ND90Pr]|uniref:F-box domain-containing protein n=1 Tax=Cochliobolus sativus (strain ND90Pr / ATCC 201652) TaxID=665912 RepID=M2T1G9_COCSN|nr:uncharacterized protein COCSADRAFT_272050 [Bipolaris sorokiniana ND90Pr]EMD68365.1 hypothetical protein COCSADRAFT_272050 [Bipolaris sorokiniana ND90Pr]
MPGLLSLPTELLQQIASSLPCSSALNLLSVNHQLRKACNDRLVFQQIAKRDLNYSSLSKWGIQDSFIRFKDDDPILTSASLSETIRLAFAAEKCIKSSTKKSDAWIFKVPKNTRRYDVLDWLPHMIALEHSAATSLKPEPFVIMYNDLVTHKAPENDLITASFMITRTLLHQLRYCVNVEKQVKKPLDKYFEANPGRSISPHADSITYLRNRVRRYGRFNKSFRLDEATALLPTFLLELAVYQLFPEQLRRQLPSVSSIGFASLMRIPPMFPQDATTSPSFAECHVEKMVRPMFLAGKWTGYYSEQRDSVHVRSFDPPMSDINIVARVPEGASDVAAVIDRETRGVDSHGEFSLQGRVKKNGQVELVKRYLVSGYTWPWMGCMTPFGIVGTWGDQSDELDEFDSFGGYFWIWKEEWCEGDR